jgi:hypothetical protein
MLRWLQGWKYILIVVGLVILALLIMDFNSRMEEWRSLTVQKENISAQVTSLAATNAYLEKQIAFATSPAGVMEWAYQDGHWVRPEDYLVVPISPDGGSEPAPTPVPVVIREPVENWQLWVSLFFDMP